MLNCATEPYPCYLEASGPMLLSMFLLYKSFPARAVIEGLYANTLHRQHFFSSLPAPAQMHVGGMRTIIRNHHLRKQTLSSCNLHPKTLHLTRPEMRESGFPSSMVLPTLQELSEI